MARIVLAMSGGVDSSVAAHLLIQQGHDVRGVYLRRGAPRNASGDELALPQASAKTCGGPHDADDAARVADQLGIPFHVLDAHGEFQQIMEYFVEEYSSGRTPNPCVVCNREVKFGRLVEYADSQGADLVASGHYVRLARTGPGGDVSLLRGVDPDKDQSYVLFSLRRSLLKRLAFPVGEHRKQEIRRLAAEIKLPVANKQESQEVCFVPGGRHDQFVRDLRGDLDTSGEIVTVDGRVVGHHAGIERFTIGQRKGLGVALGEPHFVVRIERDARRVVIGKRDDLARGELTADRVNWLVDPPGDSFRCQAKIRYNSPAAAATVTQLSPSRLRLEFDEPRFGVAPGQAAVCYQDDQLLGGGWIE